MKHDHFRICLDEWFKSGQKRLLTEARSKIARHLIGLGFQSLERGLRDLLLQFVGPLPDLPEVGRVYYGFPDVFVTCFRLEEAFVFVDFEGLHFEGDRAYLKVDIFAESEPSLRAKKELLVDQVMKCFGLTASKAALLAVDDDEADTFTSLRSDLVSREPIDGSLFRLLQDEQERGMLRELKRRGSVLERDLDELCPPSGGVASAKETLDYLSGDEYHLVERKYAIVCRATQELVFPLRRREDFEGAKNLECPKCSKLFAEEEVMAFYAATDDLRELIDGSRWLPLLVRDAFLQAGLPAADVYMEVKHGEDEIDVLVFYRERIIAVEAKNRPVNLNDAYKLSAKASKFEAVVDRSRSRRYRRWREIVEDRESDFLPKTATADGVKTVSQRILESDPYSCLPVVISTHDISGDAQDLLIESNYAAKFLDHCDGKIIAFIKSLVQAIDDYKIDSRLNLLLAHDAANSVVNLAAEQIRDAFISWRHANR